MKKEKELIKVFSNLPPKHTGAFLSITKSTRRVILFTIKAYTEDSFQKNEVKARRSKTKLKKIDYLIAELEKLVLAKI